MKSFADIPAGWTVTSLGRLVERISGGGTPSKSDPENFSGNIPFMTVKDMKGRFVSDTIDHISEKALNSSATTLVPADTLVVATRMSLGKIVRPLMDVAINQDLKALFLKDGIDKTYIEHFWRYSAPAIQKMGTGTTVKGIRLEDVRSLPVPVPPSGEQRRIADKLDRVLARVDAANEHLSRVGPLLKRFRQEVLREAVSGRILGGNGYKGRRVALSEVCDMRLGKMLDQAKNKGNFVPYIGNINVRWFGFDLSSLKRIRIESHEVGDLEISDGDLMVCEGGEPGRCAVWNGGATDIVFQKALHRVRPHEGVLDSWWLAYNLKIQCDSGEISGLLTGSTIKHLTGRSLGRFSFYLPDYEEQRRIVAIVKSLFAFADILEGRTLTTKQNVQRLFPSVLSKAFRGDLIPQILGDEPASEFLARVAETKASENHEPIRRKRQASA